MSAYLPYSARLRSILWLLDTIGLAVAIYCAHTIRFDRFQRPLKWQELLDRPGLLIWSVIAGWIFAVAAELYEPEVLHRRRETMLRVLAMVTAWSLAVVVATYLRPSWAYGRGVLALTTIFWSADLVLSRWSLRTWLYRRTRFPALVVGDPESVRRFCRDLRLRPSAPWSPVDGSALTQQGINREIGRLGASIVVLTGSDEHALGMGPDLTAMHFSGVPVVAASEIWAWLEERLPLEALTPALFLHQPGFGGIHWTLFNRVTRIADVILASLFLVLFLPIFLVASSLVLICDGRPILYRQRRVGQYGRHFIMYKLRTMNRDAESNGPEFATVRDPRITLLGSILRRFRIDELPQLLNILRGEMSLVGPRPERPEFVAQLTEEIQYYAFRLAVPPGLTGWAQVNTSYARDSDDHRRKLEFDLYFIRERSLRLYLLTLLRTVSAALVGVRRR